MCDACIEKAKASLLEEVAGREPFDPDDPYDNFEETVAEMKRRIEAIKTLRDVMYWCQAYSADVEEVFLRMGYTRIARHSHKKEGSRTMLVDFGNDVALGERLECYIHRNVCIVHRPVPVRVARTVLVLASLTPVAGAPQEDAFHEGVDVALRGRDGKRTVERVTGLPEVAFRAVTDVNEQEFRATLRARFPNVDFRVRFIPL